jgi:hypothetical protein
MKNSPLIGSSLIISALMATAMVSCELINPEETIPAFLKIDSVSISTSAGEGHPVHNITDAWVYDNDQLVGIFELPAVVPVIRNGVSSIRIRAGIKLNGQVGTRIPLLFTNDYQADLELFPDSLLPVNPTLTFRNDVTFAWLEDFDDIGLSLSASPNSNAVVERISGDEAYNGNSLKMALNASQNIFECRTISGYELPNGGIPVIMEFTYRCNHPFVVGLYSGYPGGSVQVPIVVLNATETWNHIYVNLTDAVSANPNYIDHRPFFGFLRDEGFEGEIDVYIDDIRMLH